MTNSNQKERFQTKIAMLEQNNQVLQNKCEEYLGELIRTRKALDVAVDALKRIDETRSGVKENLHATNGRALNAGNGFCWATIDDINNALEQITALKKSELENLEMLVNNVFK